MMNFYEMGSRAPPYLRKGLLQSWGYLPLDFRVFSRYVKLTIPLYLENQPNPERSYNLNLDSFFFNYYLMSYINVFLFFKGFSSILNKVNTLSKNTCPKSLSMISRYEQTISFFLKLIGVSLNICTKNTYRILTNSLRSSSWPLIYDQILLNWVFSSGS